MEIGTDMLDYDLLDNPQVNNNPEPEPEPELEPQPSTEASEGPKDVISTLLKELGIDNPDEVNYENEYGEVEKIPFSQLPIEDQLNILRGEAPKTIDDELDDEEIELLNEIRARNISPKEYLQSLNKMAVEDYVNQNQTVEYAIDNYSDDDLFLYDLMSKMPDLTPERAGEILEKQKEDEEYFVQQCQALRAMYKLAEDNQRAAEQELAEAEQLEQFQLFQDGIVGEIRNLDSIGDIQVDLTDQDKELLANFILSRDENGLSYFGLYINDPANLTKLAYYALYGDELFNQLNSYYQQLIREVSRNRYNQGLLDGNSGKKPHLAVKQTQTTKSVPTIEDFDDDLI